MTKHVVALLIGAVIGSCWIGASVTQAQQVPESVRQELQRQGMTVEEARRQAEQMGIDLSDPEQAVQRARQLGVPEARIQALLRAYDQSMQMEFGGAVGGPSGQALLRPTLAGGAVVSPDTVLVDELPKTVNVRVRLRGETLISGVSPFFISAVQPFGGRRNGPNGWNGQDRWNGGQGHDVPSQQYSPQGGSGVQNPQYAPEQYQPNPLQRRQYDAQSQEYWSEQRRQARTMRGQRSPYGQRRDRGIDTLRVQNIRRVSGTATDGVWEGRITLPVRMRPGVFALRVQVTDRDDVTTVISTNQRLVVHSDRVDLAERDTTKAPRDTQIGRAHV